MNSPENHERTGFRPVGEPTVVHSNPWYSVERQPMDFVDPDTGIVRKSAAEGGQMNYVRMMPGVQVVGDMGGEKTLLVPQERYVTNLVYGKPVWHYELPGGGIEAHDTGHGVEFDEAAVLKAASREFGEETGYEADDYQVVGSPRGLMTHSGMSTHHTVTVLARGVKRREDGALHEATEIVGQPEEYTWDDAHEMYLNPEGLWTPDGSKIISSVNTANSLNIAHRYLERAHELGKTVIDLKSKE